MTEYVITEVSLHQWLVFADRKCIASCADEVEADKAMKEHSARRPRSPEPMSNARAQAPASVGTPISPNAKPAGFLTRRVSFLSGVAVRDTEPATQ